MIRIGLALLVVAAFGTYIDINLEAVFTGGSIIFGVAALAMIAAGFLISRVGKNLPHP